jgi:hypothetical protein
MRSSADPMQAAALTADSRDEAARS